MKSKEPKMPPAKTEGTVKMTYLDPIEFDLDKARMGKTNIRWVTKKEMEEEFGGRDETK